MANEPENRQAEVTERLVRLQVVTLAVAGLVLLLFCAWRFGFHRIFTAGWWRL